MSNFVIASSANVRAWGSDEQTEIRDRVVGNIEDVYDIFAEKQIIGLRNMDYYMGRQWTPEEVQAHIRQHRKAYIFNETFSKVDHLIGTQTQTRMDAKALPREKSDEGEAALVNFIIKWWEQLNNIEALETEVFTDSTIQAAGASVVRWKREEIEEGYPSIETVPINELYWDANSKKTNLEDARWMARVQYLSRRELKEMFPHHSKRIDDISIDCVLNTYNAVVKNIQTRRQEKFTGAGRYRKNDDDILPLIEHYEWELNPTYIVGDETQGQKYTFESESEALDYYDGLMDQYAEDNVSITNPDGSPMVVVACVGERDYFQTVLIGDEFLEREEIATPFFPYDINFCYFNKGDYWAFVDNLISPQDLVNRSFSQLDYQLGATVKGAVTVIPSLLQKGYNLEHARQEWSKTTPFIPVLDHRAFNPIPPGRVQPELFQEVNFGIQRMNDYAGGKNALGLQESAAESGRAVIARAEQGGISRLPIFDKLRLWRQSVTIKAVWYIKNFMTPGQILRVIGMDEDVQYIELDDGLLDTIREIKVDIVIDEAMKSATAKERDFMQLKELFAVAQYPAEIALPLLLEYSSLPESKKSKIQSMLGFYQQYMEQQGQQQHQQMLQKQAEDSVKRQQLRESLEMGEQLDEANKELAKKQQSTKVKLNDIEQIKMQLQDKNLSVTERNKLFDKLNTREEIGSRASAATPVS